jgi:hypothetical protein
MPKMEVELVPWRAPNFARQKMPPRRREEGFIETPAIPVADLPADTLRTMAEAWLVDLYAKAGKPHDWRFD